MKRFISLLLTCMILCSIVPVYAGEAYPIDEPYDFGIYPYNPEFKRLELSERYSIPEELVPQMTTKALVETYLICGAPGQWMMMDITKLGNFVMGRVYPYSNVLRELLDREDLTETLFSLYDASEVPAMTEEQIENMNAWLSGQRPPRSESVFWADIAQARTQSLEELMIVDQIHNGEYTWEEKQQLYPMLEEKKLTKTSLSDQYGYADRVYEWYVMSTGSFRGSDWPFDPGDPVAVGDDTGLVHPIGIPSKVYTHFGREVTTSYNRVPDFSSSQISKALRFIEDDYDVIYVAKPTVKYNCHSYAWYSRDYSSNFHWMETPAPYFNRRGGNPDYDQVDISLVQPNDVLYWPDFGEGDHSAEVYSVRSDGVIYVKAKWGTCGLYISTLAEACRAYGSVVECYRRNY